MEVKFEIWKVQGHKNVQTTCTVMQLWQQQAGKQGTTNIVKWRVDTAGEQDIRSG